MPDDLDSSTGAHPSAHRNERPTNQPPSPSTAGPLSATYPAEADLPYDEVHYGPDIAGEHELRLLGDLEGRRILVLGCGGGQAPIAMAASGAKVIGVDASAEALARTREAAERSEVKVELHQSDLAELAFLRADSIDLIFSAYALATVDDLDRVFRQAHRVLRPDMLLVFSLPHPAFALVDPASNDPLRVRRSYWDDSPRRWESRAVAGQDHPHTASAVFSGLSRANFRVETILEPEPAEGPDHSIYWTEPMRWIPATLIVRGRKEGT